MGHASSVHIHPQAIVETDAVGEGTRVWAFAHLQPGCRVGAHCNIGEGVFVEEGVVVGNRVTIKNRVQVWRGVTLEDCVFVGPGVAFTNDPTPRVEYPLNPSDFALTVVRRGASLGAHATLVAPVEIGPYAMVGAGAVVTRDVPAHRLVVGVPARPVGWACRCGASLGQGPKLECRRCGRCYREMSGQLHLLEGR